MQRECYVVCIYHRAIGRPEEIAGVVQAPQSGREAPFRSLAQLAAIFRGPKRHLRHPSPPSPDSMDLSAAIGQPALNDTSSASRKP